MKRIAAGEVVERPASVAKELIENSIDAGASSITLIVRGSGLELIQVTDNGSGMSEEDVRLCVMRHATSKIASADDLEAIGTFGFRGEALASIGSVSRMVIVTRSAEAEAATELTVENGEMRDTGKTAAVQGTSVAVKDLFSAVPARRKFLKSPATELRQIMMVFRTMALSHPGLDFLLIIDDEKTLDLRKTVLENRVREVLGREKFGRLVPVEQSFGNLDVQGYVSRPGEFQKTRNDQFFYLNRRSIVNRSLMHAVISAYGPRLGRNEYPAYILFLSIDAHRFDVNVHPTKIEVRFADEKYMHDALHRAVAEALRTRQSVPEFHLVRDGRPAGHAHIPPGVNRPFINDGQLSLDAQRPAGEKQGESGRDASSREPAQFWQIHNRYILSQIKSGLTLIDQHVAHERILYEKAMWVRQTSGASSQQLLFPVTLEIPPQDLIILTEILPFLEKIGFGIRQFGGNTVMIDAVPMEVKSGREKEVVLDILDEYKENRTQVHDTGEAVAKSFACKAAIKSGDALTQHEMAALVDQLFATRDPYFCPHGRPIVINLSLEEIDKRFGR
ncbi:DNA mismatch repair endonuclease MutL [bacterium]|nr:DNA mismatch repair endonuclease MutL [bacterium]